MNPFHYTTLAEEPDALDELGPEVRPLAGGTDLIPRLKLGLEQPAVLVDLKTGELPVGVQRADGAWRIGALTTLRAVQDHHGLRATATALTQAVSEAATPQLRNRATLGGNILQRPRCWYYRDPDLSCWLDGGDDCPARHGRNEHHAVFGTDRPCVAVHPSDPAVALVALGGLVTLRSPIGERTVPLSGLLHPPTETRRIEHGVSDREVVTALTVPVVDRRRSSYVKAMDRATWAFALVSVAAVATLDDDGIASDVCLVAGGVANTPLRLGPAEAAVEGRHPVDAAERAAEAADDGATALSRNGYKLPILRELTRRAVLSLLHPDTAAG
ncbi:MAG: xanthine dehydrogenase family protein subunit M [Acidimicrobiia bacterium]